MSRTDRAAIKARILDNLRAAPRAAQSRRPMVAAERTAPPRPIRPRGGS